MSDRKDKLTSGQVLPMQFRALSIKAEPATEADDRTVKNVSVSSDEPYERWYGTEILRHDAECVDLSRISAKAAPLLYNHDRDALLGKVSNPRLENGRLLCDFKFSSSERAKQALQDLREGILTECSIGYSIEKMEVDEKEETYTATRWGIHEVSLVTIPADYSVGVGRDAEVSAKIELVFASDLQKQVDKPNQQIDTPSMSEAIAAAPQINVDNARQEAVAAERKRVQDIQSWGRTVAEKRRINLDQPIADHIANGATLDQFRGWVLENEFNAQPVRTSPEIGMSKKDKESFSLVRACRSIAHNGKLDGFEREISDATAKAYRMATDERTIVLPEDLARHALFERAVTAGVASEGGFTVAQQMLSLIEILRNKTVLGQVGVTELSGLVGDVVFPQQLTGATAYWVSETGALTDSSATFGQKTMTPHRLGATIPYSTQFLAQSSLSAEQFLRNDLMTVLAIELDRAGLLGSGVSGEPLGVANTTGINATVTYGGAATWADVVEHETGIAVDNADIGGMAFILSAATVGKWKTILKDSVAGAGYLLSENMTANGYAAKRSNQISSANQSFFGVWAQLIRGSWAGMSVIVDPYALKKSGQVEITINSMHDYLARQPLAFNVSTDSAAQ